MQECVVKECVVCLDELTDFVVLPCEHELCVVCYPKVNRSTGCCPLCNRTMNAAFVVDVDEVAPSLPSDPDCDRFFRSMCVVFCVLVGYSIYLSSPYLHKP